MLIRDLYWKIPYDWRLGQLWYQIKCFCWHRYTTVKPRYLDHTWTDRCEVLPHMMFEILSDFIEKECQPEYIEWYGEYGRKIGAKYVRDEMQDLYDWWHQIYNKQYHKVEERLWEHVHKHKPVVDWVEIEDDCQEYRPTWKTDRDEKLYKLFQDATINQESRMEAELKANLHRIIEIMPYMWT